MEYTAYYHFNKVHDIKLKSYEAILNKVVTVPGRVGMEEC